MPQLGANAQLVTSRVGDLAISITANYTADAHSSVRYTLLGDGLDQYAASRDGIYLVTLQLSGTQSTPSPILTPSAPFYYVLNKGLPFNDVVTVVNSFTTSHGISSSLVQYMANVPEPGTLRLVAMSVIGTCLVPRARRSVQRG